MINMQYRRILIDRIVIEESTKEERNTLVENGFYYTGNTYFGEDI